MVAKGIYTGKNLHRSKHTHCTYVSFLVFKLYYSCIMGFTGSSAGKESTCKAGDSGSIPELGRSHGEGIGNPLQYSCLENSMDREAWWAIVHRVTKSQKRLSDLTLTNVPLSPRWEESL